MSDLERNADFLFYNSENGTTRVQVIVGDETVWTTQKGMGEIFGVETNTIIYHLGEIYKSEELNEIATTRKIRVVQKEGTRDVEREVQFYNLDYAELQAEKNKLMKMQNWIDRVDAFLRFNEYKVLSNAGSVSRDVADSFAQSEYAKFKIIQEKDQSVDFKKAMDTIRTTGRLPNPVEQENKFSTFDQQLKGLLNTPPPKKNS